MDVLPAAPRYTVAVVARRLGIAPATLRTWDRRYGLGPTGHESGTRRRYSSQDLARLQHMRRLTLEGVAPAEAAHLALASPLEQVEPESHVGSLSAPGATAAAPAPSGPTAGRAGRSGLAAAAAAPARSGGRILAMPGAAATARGLGRAAMALDAPAVTAILSRALVEDGPAVMWDGLLRPVLSAAGRRWEQTGEGVEVEHLLSECALGVMRNAVVRPRDGVRHRPVLVACAAGELHSMPSYALSAALADSGVHCRVLGADVPFAALSSATRRLGPAVVFVYALMPTSDLEPLIGLPATRPRTTIVAGGPGWDPGRVPPHVPLTSSLHEARLAVLRAVSA
jgi:transposase-like protein/methanogenic corrinoid protein MtbC1